MLLSPQPWFHSVSTSMILVSPVITVDLLWLIMVWRLMLTSSCNRQAGQSWPIEISSWLDLALLLCCLPLTTHSSFVIGACKKAARLWSWDTVGVVSAWERIAISWRFFLMLRYLQNDVSFGFLPTSSLNIVLFIPHQLCLLEDIFAQLYHEFVFSDLLWFSVSCLLYTALTTPRSQLIAAPAVTFKPDYPTTLPPDNPSASDPEHFVSAAAATQSGFEPVTTMSKKTNSVPNTKKTVNNGGPVGGALTPRRSTTMAPKISTTGPPKGRRPGKPGSGGSGTNTGSNNGGSVVGNNPNGTPKVGTPVDERITTNGTKPGSSGGSGAGAKPGSSPGGSGAGAGTGGKNGNTNQNGNTGSFDTSGIGNLFPGLSGGPAVTVGYQPSTKYSHFGECPSEYKYYCLNGGKCTWLVKLAKPSCR